MRRGVKNRKHPAADPVFNSEKVSRFINYVMLDGKKQAARKIVYGAFEIIKASDKKVDPLEVFEEALRNVGPVTEVRSRRVGGANYQVPREVRPDRRIALGMRWILLVTRKRTGKSMDKILAEELLLASQNEGEAVKKRENTHKMAEANKAFAHFAW